MCDGSSDPIEAMAQRLWDAQWSKTPCAPPSDDLAEFDVQTAYEIQERIIHWRRVKRGLNGPPAAVVGRKIGLTSDAIQDWLGVTEPDFGVLLDDMIVADGDTASMSHLLQPRIEAEVAFILGDELVGPGLSAGDVVSATDHVLPALEIIDSHIADWDITYEDTIADNASSGLFVLGNSPRQLSDVDLRLAGMKLRQNGRIVSTGAGAACMGHPINAVVWLGNTLAEFDQHLNSGDIVLSGAIGPAVDVDAGDDIRADIAGLGSVSVHFDN